MLDTMKRATLCVAAVALAVGGCGDSTGTLSQTEAEELAAVIAGLTATGLGGLAGPQAAPATEVTFELELENVSGPCSEGGTANLTGSLVLTADDETGDFSVGFDYTITPNDCRERSPNDIVFTLDGDPNITVEGTLSGTQTSLEGSITQSGGVRWETGGRSGSCTLNLTTTYDFTSSDGGETFSGSASMSGTVCGVTISQTVTVSA